MQPLLDAVRKATLPAVWSQGVKLARENAVSRAGGSGGELVVRVRAPGHAVAPTVTLYVDDVEWSCDCGGKVDPCAHVAAATIAASQGLFSTEEAAPSAGGARLVYRLAKQDRILSLARLVVHPDGREEKLAFALTSDLARGRLPEGLSPTHEDILVDRILGWPPKALIPLARLGDVFDALSRGAEVTFLGEAARLSKEPVLPRGTVEDGPNGSFVLRVERAKEVTEVVAQGVARCGDVLRPLGETETTGEHLEKLPLVRAFPRTQETELVTKVLPELEKKIEVHVATRRLTRKSVDARPRIALDLAHHGHTLSILPTLVYGDPAVARIDGDEVTLFGKAMPRRRREEEHALVLRLRDELNLMPGRRVDLDGTDAMRFAAKLRAWQGLEVEARPLEPRIDASGGAFEIAFELPGEEGQPARRADAANVLQAWRDKLDVVPLEGGGWAPLPFDWLIKHGHKVADLLAARDPQKRLPSSALPELGALLGDLDMPKPLEVGKLRPLLEGFAGIPEAPLPEGVTAELRAYQKRGVDWLSFLRDAELGAVLADDMGLGKTLQAICALRGRALVVCPKSVVFNWAAEIARFRPGLSVSVFHGPKRELDAGADVTLTTYAVLRMDVELLAKTAWDAVVLDEAQAIKNETSQTARAAFALRGAFRLALSGTPVENRLEELWSVMTFANPGLLGGRGDFQERYAAPIGGGDAAAAARLRAKIRPFVLRRMKREVLPELPPRTEAVMHVELEEAERVVYDAVRAAAKDEVARELAAGGGVMAALEALLRLRQAACHPSLVPGQRAESSTKIEALVEALEDAAADGHKALVFSQWTSFLDLVEPHLRAASLRFTRLDGSTRDRAAPVAEFQDDAGPPVMLVSLKAGGTGLNLTAADHVFLLDPWWNPAVEDQAADRAHRIGQDKPVMVYRLIARDTVEERIFALQEKKRRLAEVALGEAGHAGGITREELLSLLD